MSIRPVPFVTGEYYHLYNRGNSKQIIFNDEQDHLYFINLLKIVNNKQRVKSIFNKTANPEDTVVSVGAYCLMTNHFHILVKQEKDGGISTFMQKLLTGYSMYYNKKYKRTGSLFEGKFKSKYAGEDTYLKYLFSYIHLNPLKLINPNWKHDRLNNDKSILFLKNYKYSSFLEYLNDSNENNRQLINREAFPDYFPTKSSFIREIFSWIYLYQEGN